MTLKLSVDVAARSSDKKSVIVISSERNESVT